MLEVDVLINDYSSTSTDFSLLNRPQIFYLPDYDLYSSEKGFVEDYRATLPGVEVFNFEELKKQLIYCLSHTDQYLNKFNGMRKELTLPELRL